MTDSSRTECPFTARFVETDAKLLLELTNTTNQQLKCVEILTIFLKDEDVPGGGPSRAHIKFEEITSIRPQEKVTISHRTWIDGKPVDPDHDELERLKEIVGQGRPYVLDISWEDAEGKSRYQRIPVGH